MNWLQRKYYYWRWTGVFPFSWRLRKAKSIWARMEEGGTIKPPPPRPAGMAWPEYFHYQLTYDDPWHVKLRGHLMQPVYRWRTAWHNLKCRVGWYN